VYNPSLESITIDKSELFRRLKAPLELFNAEIEEYIDAFKTQSSAKCCASVCNVNVSENLAEFEFGTFKSAGLAKCLSGCKRVCIMGATLGVGADRLIHRMEVVSKSKAFVADAVASALIEAVMDDFCSMLKEKYNLTPRFSPGYGDFELSAQRMVLDALNADRILGIKLGESFIMTPRKSITAICGIIE